MKKELDTWTEKLKEAKSKVSELKEAYDHALFVEKGDKEHKDRLQDKSFAAFAKRARDRSNWVVTTKMYAIEVDDGSDAGGAIHTGDSENEDECTKVAYLPGYPEELYACECHSPDLSDDTLLEAALVWADQEFTDWKVLHDKFELQERTKFIAKIQKSETPFKTLWRLTPWETFCEMVQLQRFRCVWQDVDTLSSLAAVPLRCHFADTHPASLSKDDENTEYMTIPGLMADFVVCATCFERRLPWPEPFLREMFKKYLPGCPITTAEPVINPRHGHDPNHAFGCSCR